MARSKHLQTVLDFCLDRASQAPVSERIFLYRGLAEVCGDEQDSARLKLMADSLEDSDRLCREFAFQLSENQKS